jgi:hypothetical protein
MIAGLLRFFSKTQDVREPFASSAENKKLPQFNYDICDIKDRRNDDININLEALEIVRSKNAVYDFASISPISYPRKNAEKMRTVRKILIADF